MVRLMYCCNKRRSARANPTGMTVRIRTQKCMTELYLLLKEFGGRAEVENSLQSDNKTGLSICHIPSQLLVLFLSFCTITCCLYHVVLVPNWEKVRNRNRSLNSSLHVSSLQCQDSVVSWGRERCGERGFVTTSYSFPQHVCSTLEQGCSLIFW